MFEIPAVHQYDFEIYGGEAKKNAMFRALEIEEIKQNNGDPNASYKYVELRNTDFVGLVTKSVYNQEGELLSDLFSAFQEATGPKTNPRKSLRYNKLTDTFENLVPDGEEYELDEVDPVEEDDVVNGASDASDRDNASDDESVDNSSNVNQVNGTDSLYQTFLKKLVVHPFFNSKEFIALNSGCVALPRSTLRPTVRLDSEQTQNIVQQSLNEHVSSSHKLSPAAQAVLMRSNYRVPYRLHYNLDDDEWSKLQMRRRSSHVVTSLLYISMERRDYERAWMALTCSLRGSHVDVRLLWMPAIELLAWRHESFPRNTKSPQDLLSWLIAMNPRMPKTRHNMHRYIPKSTDLMPVSILLKLVNEDFREAMEEAQQAVKSFQHSLDPFCWGLAGSSRLFNAHLVDPNTIANVEYTEVRHIQQDFIKCIDLGGCLPKRIRRSVVSLGSPSEDVKEKSLDGINEDESSADEVESESSEEEAIDDMNRLERNDTYVDSNIHRDEEEESDDNDDNDDDDERTTSGSNNASSADDTDNSSNSNDSDDPSHDSRSEYQQTIDWAIKRGLELDDNETLAEESGTLKRPKIDQNSQNFYSQATSSGAELGSSDSDDYL